MESGLNKGTIFKFEKYAGDIGNVSSDMVVTTTPMSVQESLDRVAQILGERDCPVVARTNLKTAVQIESIENLMARITADFAGDSPYSFADR